MIVKSFFRKPITVIYIILLVTIISVLGILNSTSLNINEKINDIYYQMNIFFIKSKESPYEKLIADNRMDNIRRAIPFSAVESDQMIEDDYSSNTQFTWSSLSYYSFSTMLTYKDEDCSLNNNEIAVGLDTVHYNNISNNVDKYIDKKIIVLYNDTKYEFIIKDIYDAGYYSEFKIASSTYDELVNKASLYIYTFKLKKEEYLNQIKSDYSIFIKSEDEAIAGGASSSSDISDAYEQFKSEYKNLKKAIYFLYVVFIIMLIIIGRNIIEDMELNIKLERLLGYNKNNIRINILKRLFSLYGVSLVVSIILSTIVSLIMNNFYNYNLIIFNYNYYIRITLLLIFLNILTILLINKKLNIYSRK